MSLVVSRMNVSNVVWSGLPGRWGYLSAGEENTRKHNSIFLCVSFILSVRSLKLWKQTEIDNRHHVEAWLFGGQCFLVLRSHPVIKRETETKSRDTMIYIMGFIETPFACNATLFYPLRIGLILTMFLQTWKCWITNMQNTSIIRHLWVSIDLFDLHPYYSTGPGTEDRQLTMHQVSSRDPDVAYE